MREHSLTFAELERVVELEREVGHRAKFNDCSVLFLALKLGAMLLSGDKPLRVAGAACRVPVHGTLWIFDQLVDHGILPGAAAAAKLEHLITLKRFLPVAEVHARLRKWRAG